MNGVVDKLKASNRNLQADKTQLLKCLLKWGSKKSSLRPQKVLSMSINRSDLEINQDDIAVELEQELKFQKQKVEDFYLNQVEINDDNYSDDFEDDYDNNEGCQKPNQGNGLVRPHVH